MTQFAQKRGHYGPCPRWKFFFFCRNNKSRSSAQLSESFHLLEISCFDWVMDLFLSWEMLSVKKVSFPVKTAVLNLKTKYFINSKQRSLVVKVKKLYFSSFCHSCRKSNVRHFYPHTHKHQFDVKHDSFLSMDAAPKHEKFFVDAPLTTKIC